MLHILLLVLKIIGIILVAITAFILLVGSAPFFYTGKGEFKENVKVRIVARWVANIIYFRFSYENEEMKYILRIFGIPIIRGTVGEEELDDDLGQLTEDFEKDSGIKDNLSEDNITKNTKEAEGFEKCNEKKNKSIAGKLRNLSKKVRAKIHALTKSIKKFKINIKKIKRFITSEKTKVAYYYAKDIIKKIYNHIKPSKAEADITFGFDSPDKTGKMLAVLGMLYGTIKINPEKVNIVPDFQEKKLEGSFYVKGKFVLIYMLVMVLKLYFKKEVHDIIEKFDKE